MFSSLVRAISSWFAVLDSWIQSVLSAAAAAIEFGQSSFLFFVCLLHSACIRILAPRNQWKTLFAFTEESDEVAVVIRVGTAFGFDDRIQGRFMLQQGSFGNLYRVLVDGNLVTDDDNGEQVKGKRITGAIYFPDDVNWQPQFKKVKGNNTTTIRGRSSMIVFPESLNGLRVLQVTFVYTAGCHKVAKQVSASFELVLNEMSSA